jgi:hypothetical protein
MEDQDDCDPQDERAIRDRIDDEIVNHELMEYLDAASALSAVPPPLYNSQSAPPRN